MSLPTMPDFGWADGSAGGTPLDAAELEAFGQYIAGYARTLVAGGALVPTAVKSANYTASPADFVPCDISAGNLQVTLPTAPTQDSQVGVEVVKIAGTPGATQVTIACGGADVFDVAGGPTTTTISALGRSAVFEYKGGIWYRIAGNSALNTPLGAAELGSDGTVGGPGGSPLNATLIPLSVKAPAYGAKGGAVALSSGAVVATNVLSDTTHHPFSNSAVGDTVVLDGMGTAGIPFTTTIQGFTDTGHVTLTASPPNPGGGLGSYRFGTDDTAAFQSAMNAVVGAGEVMVPADSYLVTSVTPMPGVTMRGYGSNVWKIPGTNFLLNDRKHDGSTVTSTFRCLGISFHGEGRSGYTLSNYQGHGGMWFEQWTDVYIRDCTFDGFADAAVYWQDSQRAYFHSNTITNHGLPAGRNAVNFSDSPTNNATNTPVTDFYASGNWIDSDCAGIVLSNQRIPQTVPIRAMITNNRVHATSASLFTCISAELNENGLTSSLNLRRIIISGNICTQDGSGTFCSCIYVADDGATGISDATKTQDILIMGNDCTSAGNAGMGVITCWASRSLVVGNLVNATGTGRAIYASQNPTGTGVTNITVRGNRVTLSGATTVPAIDMLNVSLSRVVDNDVTFTGTAAFSGHAINVGGTSQYVDVQRNNIDGAYCTGISVGANVTACYVTDNTIHNCNAVNASTAAFGAGIYLAAVTPTGLANVVLRNTIIDDRGTHQMTYGVASAATSGVLPIVGDDNIIQGWKTSPVNVSTTLIGSQGYTCPPWGQNPQREVSADATCQPTDQGLTATASGIVLTAPTGLGPWDLKKAFVFVNTSAGAVTLRTGTAGKLNPGGSPNATSMSLPSGAAVSLLPRSNGTDFWIA